MRAPLSRLASRRSLWRRSQRTLSLLLVVCLVASGLPQQLVRFGETGRWPANSGIALAAPIPPTITWGGSGSSGGLGAGGATFKTLPNTGSVGNVMVIAYTLNTPSPAQDIVSVTDATTGAAWTRIAGTRSGNMGAGAFWHKKQTGDGTQLHVNFAIPASEFDAPPTNIWGQLSSFVVSGALASTPFEFGSSSNHEFPGGTTVNHPNFAPLTDGELIVSIAGYLSDPFALLGTPSGTNPTFSIVSGTDGGGISSVVPGFNVSSAPATDTTPLGARTYTASAAVSESIVVVIAAISTGSDSGAVAPYTYGYYNDGSYSDGGANEATGAYTTSATDLVMPGRLLPFAFIRTYNSADFTSSPLGPAWTHSFYWTVTDAGATATLRRGSGKRDRFTSIGGGNYSNPPDVFDRLVKNGDSTYTLTLKNQIQYEFTTAGVLSRIHEPAGNQILLAYTTGKLTTITDAVGRAVTLSYDASNRLSQIQDPLGRKVTYAYDASGRLATVTDKIGNAAGQNPALHRWQYAYDGTTTRLTIITDPDARQVIKNTYGEDGRVKEQRDGFNALTTINYNGSTTVTTNPRGHARTSTYDARSRNLTQSMVVSGQTLTTTSVYDPAGNPLSFTDGNGKTTDFTYDGSGNLLTKTDPQVDLQTPRYLTQFAYDTKNNLYQITDARNFVTTRTFDPTTNVLLSQSEQIDATTSAVTKYEYNDAINKGMPTRVIAPRGNLTGTPDYAYATNLTYTTGNLMTRVDPDGATTTFTYDASGRQITLVDPDGTGASAADHTWTTAYDENDQVKSETDPMSQVLSSAYDGAGNRTSATDRNGNLTTNIYDADSRLFKVQQKPDPIGTPALVYTTQIDRDPNGNATKVTQANGVVTDYGYDELDRLVSYSTHPDGSTTLTTTFGLDGNGNVLTKTTPPGADQQITTSTYDALSRLKTVDAVGLTTIAYQYDATSSRTQMTDETGTTTYQYDGLGRLTQAAQPNGTLNYGYDRDGNRTSVVYPAGADTVTYVYTSGGRLDHLTDAAARTSTYTYTASGLAKTLLAPNGLTTSYQYDRAQRLTSVANLVGTNMRTRHTYTLDKEGNRVALDEYVEGITTAPSTTWTASVKVNSDTGTTVQDHPAIALGADGGHYLIWDDARDGNADIYFSKRDPVTGVWSTPSTKVNTDTGTRIQLNPAIALDGSSNAYAVWQDERNGASKPDIYFRQRTAAGTWVSPDVKVSDDTGGGGGAIQRNPRVAGTAAGAETAVWVDLRSSQNNIWSSQLPVGGSTWAVNKKITDNTAALKDFPDVTVGLDGTAYAVWQDRRNGNDDIYFSKLPPGATAWTANVKVSDDPGTAIQRLPRIGIDAGGNLTVVWLDDRTSPAKMRMSRLPSGASTWPTSTIVADAAARPVSVALSVRADGKAYVTFGDNRVANVEIYGSEYDPWLNSWTTSALVSDDPGSAAQQNPTVAYGISEIAAAWRDDRAGNADVRARRATLSGTDHFAMSYDGLERLTGVTATNAESFVLDAASNISSRTGPPATNTYDTANRLTSDGSLSYAWSRSDRLISRGTDSFGYDALDRLTSSTVGGTSRTYTYNGTGLLQSRTQGTSTSFVWDPGTSPSRLLRSGGDRIVYGLGPIYVVKADSSTLTFARDGLKSVRAELNSAGAVTASFRYRAYGQIAQTSGAPTPSYLGYAGQLLDPSGLYYMRARWYDTATGRFVSRDPWMGDTNHPTSLNAFGYANLNPLLLDDPTGLNPCLGIPPGLLSKICTGAQMVVTTVQRFLQRPVVQQGIQKAANAAAERAALTSSQAGQIIGWGSGRLPQEVARTEAVLNSVTTQSVRDMIAQGLTKPWVTNQLNQYLNWIDEGGKLAQNPQLGPRLQLMQKILDLWPEE